MVGKRLDLRVQDRVIDEVFDACGARRFHHALTEGNLARVHIWRDVVNRVHTGDGPGNVAVA